jgi:alpha-L-fucosidase
MHTSPSLLSTDQNDRMNWWRQARFGMFIHFGLFSIPAGEWNGREIGSYSEWIMNKAEIPVAEYARLAERFDPTAFDADAIADLARSAGMRYLILTAKHHEGFALFKSKVSPFNSADASPCGRDFVRELAKACGRVGIRFGLYYSHSQDWYHRGGAGNFWDSSQQGDYDAYLTEVAVPQVRELLENYGPVSILWYDTPRFMTAERAEHFQAVHAIQPQLIINNRLVSFDTRSAVTPGDTETPENFIPANGCPGRDWESCMTFNDNWGYRKSDLNWKSTATLLRNLSDIASKGGNFLLNIGLRGDGSVPEENAVSLSAIGEWLGRNGVSVYGTQAGPFTRRMDWGRATQRCNPDGTTTLYLHIWKRPETGAITLPGLRTEPTSGRMLASGTPVLTLRSETGVDVFLPAERGDDLIEVVALELDNPPEIEVSRPQLDELGRIVLSPMDAELSGPDDAKPVVTGSDADATISNLKRSGEWSVIFNFEVPSEGLWQISAELAIGAYHRLSVSLLGPHGTTITTAFNATGEDMNSFSLKELGVMRLHSGLQALEFRSEMTDLRPVLARRFVLTPVPVTLAS